MAGSTPTRGHATMGTTLFLLCAFPYISPIDTPFDTQPYALIGALAAVLLLTLLRERVRVPKQLLPFGLVLYFALVLYLGTAFWSSGPFSMLGFRSLVGYLSVFAIALAAYVTFRYVSGKVFVYVVLAWLLFGLIQVVADREFGGFLLPRLSTSQTRGVTALAVEPSFYAVTCIFFLVLNDVFLARRIYSKRVHLLVFGMTAVQIFLARAALGFVLLVVYLAVRLISQGSIAQIFKGAVLFAVISTALLFSFRFAPALANSRAGALLAAAQKDPSTILSSDGSTNDRLLHILASHSVIFRGNLLGLGLGNWNEHADDLTSAFDAYIPIVLVSKGGRIMSGWGSAIFELGLVGLLFVAAFVYIMCTGWRTADSGTKRLYISSFFTIYFTMLMAVPLSFPLFGYALGVFVYIKATNQRPRPVEDSTPRDEYIGFRLRARDSATAVPHRVTRPASAASVRASRVSGAAH